MTDTIYGLYEDRGRGFEFLKGVDVDPEKLRRRHNSYQENREQRYRDPLIPKGETRIDFKGSTGGGLAFAPHCSFTIKPVKQFDEKDSA